MSKRIITINRLYGSNGRQLGQILAQELGIHYYDKELIRIASEKKGIPYDELLKVDEKRASQWRYPVEDPMQMQPQYRFFPMNDVLFQTESEIIESLAEKEDCVIIGRCANHILKDKCSSVFIHAPFEYRVKTVMNRLDRTEKSSRAMIRKI
ncbi:MAG: cytidylate kinase-like family protein, partial [Bacillota bacterium]|nr:cytidylate kinase-like family protein [Bacillota bacterium]